MKKAFLLLTSFVLFSCSNNSDPEVTPLPTPFESIAYFKGILDGQTINYHQDNYISPTHSYGYENGFQTFGSQKYFFYGSKMTPYPPTSSFYPNIDLVFYNLYHSSNFSDETVAFPTLFTTPPTNFLTEAQYDNLEVGISLEYYALDGTRYSTFKGPQTGSVMTVTSSTTGTEGAGGLQIQTIVGTVNCKFYNTTDPTDVVVLTNGKYKLIFREYN